MNKITFDSILCCGLIICKILKYLEVPKIHRNKRTVLSNDLIAFKRTSKKCFNIFHKYIKKLNIVLNNATYYHIEIHKYGKLHLINPIIYADIPSNTIIKTLVNPNTIKYFNSVKSIKHLVVNDDDDVTDKCIEKMKNLSYLEISSLTYFKGKSLKNLAKLKMLSIKYCHNINLSKLYNLTVQVLNYTGYVEGGTLEKLISSSTLEFININTLLSTCKNINNNIKIGNKLKYINVNNKCVQYLTDHGFTEHCDTNGRYYYTRHFTFFKY